MNLKSIKNTVKNQIYLLLFTIFFSVGIIANLYGFFRQAYIYCMVSLFLTLCAGYTFGIYTVRKTYGLDELGAEIDEIVKEKNIDRKTIIKMGINTAKNTEKL